MPQNPAAIPDDFPETASGIREQQQSGHNKAARRRLFLAGALTELSYRSITLDAVPAWRRGRGGLYTPSYPGDKKKRLFLQLLQPPAVCTVKKP